MVATIKVVWAVVQVLWDWIMLARRVRKILTNDLPHAEADRNDIRKLVEENCVALKEHIGFCRGVRSAAARPEPSPRHPVTPSPHP